jgi:HEAT repeat protein
VYTNGKVRAVYRKQWTSSGGDLIMRNDSRVVETDSPTNHGDSGGPLCNDRGELVGITQGGSATANAISVFIDHSECEDFITKTVASTLAGKAWKRDERPPLVASGGGDAKRLPSLVAKLSSPDDALRAEGAQGLALLGPDAHIALPELLRGLGDKNPFVKRLVAQALQQVGQPTVADLPDLLPLLEESATCSEAKARILEALAVLGDQPQATPAAANVVKLAQDSDARIRREALRAVGKMASAVPPAQPAVSPKDAQVVLEKALQDSDPKVRGAAAEALTMHVPAVRGDVTKLVELLKGKEPEVRAPAARALGLLGEKAKPALPDLLAAARVDDRSLRRACFVTLKAIKAPPAEVMPVLRPGLKDDDVEVRRAALGLAAQAGPAAKDLLPSMVEALADSDVRVPALDALKQLGPDAKEHAPAVASLLATDKTLRKDTLEAIEAMKPTGPTAQLVVPKMLAVLEDEKAKPVRDKVAEAMARIGRVANPELVKALTHPNPAMRGGAATCLGALGTEAHFNQVLQALQGAYSVEGNATAKKEMLDAIKRIGASPLPKS